MKTYTFAGLLVAVLLVGSLSGWSSEVFEPEKDGSAQCRADDRQRCQDRRDACTSTIDWANDRNAAEKARACQIEFNRCMSNAGC